LFLSSFIPDSGSFDPSHVIILLPIFQIIQGLSFHLIAAYINNKVLAYVIISSLFFLYVSGESQTMLKVFRELQPEDSSVGISLTSELTTYLKKENINEVLCFENRLLAVIDFLSNLKILTWGFNVNEKDYWNNPSHAFNLPDGVPLSVESVYEYQLKTIDQFYLIRNRSNSFSEDCFWRLKKLIERDNKELVFIREFKKNLPDMHLELYRVQSPTPAFLEHPDETCPP